MSLTAEEVAIIKATVPVLEEGGVQLTTHFYDRMMRENPEVRKYFNQTSQANGSQARALASAVLKYAKNIDKLENLGPVASNIIQRHVALDIQPEHYPIVGTNLIHSMTEVLGPDVATPQVLNAWTKAYEQLAALLIKEEASVYSKIDDPAHGGWKDFRDFIIKRETEASPGVMSFWMEPADGRPVFKSQPGQYITLRVVVDGQEHRRSYSISSAPSSQGYRITVKAIGTVSRYLHGLNVGDKVELRPPMGQFVWDPERFAERDLIFIAGGTGITPMAAMALAGAPATLLYYAHEDKDRALLDELRTLQKLKHVAVGSRPTKEEFATHISDNSIVFCVGPPRFMESVQHLLEERGFSMDNAYFEFFGSKP